MSVLHSSAQTIFDVTEWQRRKDAMDIAFETDKNAVLRLWEADREHGDAKHDDHGWMQQMNTVYDTWLSKYDAHNFWRYAYAQKAKKTRADNATTPKREPLTSSPKTTNRSKKQVSVVSWMMNARPRSSRK